MIQNLLMPPKQKIIKTLHTQLEIELSTNAEKEKLENVLEGKMREGGLIVLGTNNSKDTYETAF